MEYFDTHFHVQPEDDLNEMQADAVAAGVTRMLVAGAPVGDMAAMAERTLPFDHVYLAAGVHPHEAEQFDGDMALYRELAATPQVRAIGEIGLDYFYSHSEPDVQKRTLGAFLDLAAETGLPAILHAREADADVYQCLKDHLPAGHPFVVHCFTGTPQWAEKYLELGGHLSFTGIATFPKAQNVRDAMRVVPTDRLMIETDSPYLAPKPYRGKRNRPAYVVHVGDYIAETFGIEPAAFAQLTTNTAKAFFNVD